MSLTLRTATTIVHTDDYIGYVSPYFVISKGKFTKHYFEGTGRIVSKLGNGSFAQPLKLTAGGVNYGKLTAEQQKALDNYVKTLGVPPGPPTQHGIYATPEFTGDPYPSEVIKPVEENQEPPEGWPRNPIFNAPGDVPGPPVQFGPPVEPTTVKSGEGFTGIGLPENDIFYFHPDHLGSTSYITTKNGSISQHVEYIAFGEVLFEEHSSSFSNPYLFNGKELDRETNLSYFGARYYDAKTSLWLTIDPLTEKYPNVGGYVFCINNPINLVDPDGMAPTPFPKAIIGNVGYYAWRARDFRRQNPGKKVPDYYMNYGHKYISRFTNETNSKLSKEGQKWLVRARKNLQVAIEDRLDPKKNPQDYNTIEQNNSAFTKFAFDSHVDAYWNAGLYKLNTVDLVNIVLTPNFKDLTSADGMKQAVEMMGKLTEYWLDNPTEGLKRGAELLANQSKIKAMVVAKAIREGVDPDKAMPILDKILEKIPTIK